MRPIAIDGVAWSVCLSVGHIREPCKNGWTDRDASWRAQGTIGWGNFWGLPGPLKSFASHCCSVHSKKISKHISATAAADCITSYWPVSHCVFPHEKATPYDVASHQNSWTTFTFCLVLNSLWVNKQKLYFVDTCATPPSPYLPLST